MTDDFEGFEQEMQGIEDEHVEQVDIEPGLGAHIFDIFGHLMQHIGLAILESVQRGNDAGVMYTQSNGVTLSAMAEGNDVYLHFQVPTDVVAQLHQTLVDEGVIPDHDNQ
jgi:hypothetical protein